MPRKRRFSPHAVYGAVARQVARLPYGVRGDEASSFVKIREICV
jgi:hypothetical protein